MNKTSSAVQLQLDISALDIGETYRDRILAYKDRRISDQGVITIKAQNHRTQTRNRDEALARLQKLLKSALHVDKTRRATRPSYGAVKRRLKKKAERSEKKALRGKIRDFD